MARDTSNGALWTLGLVGLAAGAAALHGRSPGRLTTASGGSFVRLPPGARCACCSTPTGSLAKRTYRPTDKLDGFFKLRFDTGLRFRKSGARYIVYEKIGKEMLTPIYWTASLDMAGLVPDTSSWTVKEAHGSSLVRSRYDVRNAFLVPYQDTLKLPEEYKAFKAREIALFASLDADQQRAEQAKLAQRLFEKNGIGTYDDNGRLVAPTDAGSYATDKAKLRTSKAEKAEKGGGESALLSKAAYEKAYAENFTRYYRELYADRLWTLELLRRYKAETPADRRSVFSGARAKGQDLFDGLTLNMVVLEDSAAALKEEADQAAQEREIDDLVDAEKSVEGGPQIRMFEGSKRVSVFFVAQAGSQYFPYGMSRIAMLTATSKMSSPSFGLPAGRSTEGGTCPAREVGQYLFRGKSGEDAPGRREVICDRCYAMGANYGYANNMISQQGRAAWVKQFVDAKRPDLLGDQLARMITAYARLVAGGGRSEQEIGVWSKDRKRIEYVTARKAAKAKRDADPLSDRQRGVVKPVELRLELTKALLRDNQIQKLGRRNPSAILNTTAWFEALGVKDGDVCGFFRLHDSGDFGHGPVYQEAWGKVFHKLPYVQFWAPTRMWAAMRPSSAVEANPEQRAFHARLMDEFQAGAPGTSKTYDLRRAGGSRALSLASDVKHDQPEAAPTGVSPGESGTQIWELDKSLDRQVVPNLLNVRIFRPISESSPNFALRPSTLYVTQAELAPGVTLRKQAGLTAKGKPTMKAVAPEPDQVVTTGESSNIPYLDGFSAGSGVVKQIKGVYPKVYDMRGVEAYACPVYTKDEVTGREAKSCREANCRACWLAQNLPIFYGAH